MFSLESYFVTYKVLKAYDSTFFLSGNNRRHKILLIFLPMLFDELL
jgi:hypothetical protein